MIIEIRRGLSGFSQLFTLKCTYMFIGAHPMHSFILQHFGRKIYFELVTADNNNNVCTTDIAIVLYIDIL